MQNAIILLSGGLDSVTTAYYVKKKFNPKNVIALFFDYGQRTLKEEEFCSKIIAKKIGAKFKKINLKWLGKISTALINKNKSIPKFNEKDLANVQKGKKDIVNYWVPCRNSLFLLAALAHAESEFIKNNKKYDIFIGLQSEGRIPMKDTTEKFIKQVNKLSKEATKDACYRVIAPLIRYDKDEVVSLASKLKVPLEYTYSCFSGGFKNKKPVHCGRCVNCLLRKKAFYWADIKDSTNYKN